MSKKLFLLASFFIAIQNLNAQEIKFGVKAGVNFSNLSYEKLDDIYEPKSKTGFHLGGVAEYEISERFALEAQLLYSQQNSTIEVDKSELEIIGGPNPNDPIIDPETTEERDQNLQYLNLPILAKFYVYEGVNLFAGPQISFLLNDDSQYDITDFDYGLHGGVGYQFDFGLFASANYYYGLNDIDDFESAFGPDLEIRQRVFQLSVGYMF